MPLQQSDADENEFFFSCCLAGFFGCILLVSYILRQQYDRQGQENEPRIERIRQENQDIIANLREGIQPLGYQSNPDAHRLRNDNENNIENLKKEHKSEVKKLTLELARIRNQFETYRKDSEEIQNQFRENAAQVQTQQGLKTNEHASNISRIKEEHEQLTRLKEVEYKNNIQVIREEHKALLDNLQQEQMTRTDQLEQNHEKKMDKLDKDYKERVKNLEAKIDEKEAILAKIHERLEDRVERLRQEQEAILEKLRQEHTIAMETQKRTVEDSHTKHIKQLRDDQNQRSDENKNHFTRMEDKAERDKSATEKLHNRQLEQCYAEYDKLQKKYGEEVTTLRKDFKSDMDRLREAHQQERESLHKDSKNDKEQYFAIQKSLREEHKLENDRTHREKHMLLDAAREAQNDTLQRQERQHNLALTASKDMFEASQRDHAGERAANATRELKASEQHFETMKLERQEKYMLLDASQQINETQIKNLQKSHQTAIKGYETANEGFATALTTANDSIEATREYLLYEKELNASERQRAELKELRDKHEQNKGFFTKGIEFFTGKENPATDILLQIESKK